MKIGPMAYGNPEVTTGGNALKFYATLRIEIRRGIPIKNSSDQKIGNETKVKVVKNKMAPPFREAVFEIYYGKGISHEAELIDLGSTLDIVDKSGSWYSYKGERIGQGKERAIAFLQAHPEIAHDIEEQLKEAYGLIAEKIQENEAQIRFDTPPAEEELVEELPEDVQEAISEA
jgi:recombination protein RecA